MKNIFIISIAFAILTSCGNKQSEKEATIEAPTENAVELTDAQLKNSKIETGKIEQKAISSLLKVNGKIDVPPQNMVSVSVPLGGYLKSTKLLEGMHISKGEVIAVMEDQQYIQLQQDYLTAKAHFSSLEKEFQRQKTHCIAVTATQAFFCFFFGWFCLCLCLFFRFCFGVGFVLNVLRFDSAHRGRCCRVCMMRLGCRVRLVLVVCDPIGLLRLGGLLWLLCVGRTSGRGVVLREGCVCFF